MYSRHSIYSHTLTSPTQVHGHLRFPQDPQLTIARRVTCHEQSSLRIPRQTRRSEAARAETRSIALTLLHTRVVEDVLSRSSACQWLNRRVLSISTELEAHSHKLEARNGSAVPRAMIRNVHGAGVSIELAVNRCGVREKRELRSNSFLCAGIVVKSGVGCLDEEVADVEFLVGKVGGLPYGEAGGVAVPVVVWLGDVAHVMDLLAWIVLVDVFGLAVDGALEVVAAVFYAPEPVKS
jgi:hypothetical protein